MVSRQTRKQPQPIRPSAPQNEQLLILFPNHYRVTKGISRQPRHFKTRQVTSQPDQKSLLARNFHKACFSGIN